MTDPTLSGKSFRLGVPQLSQVTKSHIRDRVEDPLTCGSAYKISEEKLRMDRPPFATGIHYGEVPIRRRALMYRIYAAYTYYSANSLIYT